MVKNASIEMYLAFVKETLREDGINFYMEYIYKGGQDYYYQAHFKFINPNKAYRNITQSVFGDNELGILYDISKAIHEVYNNF